MPDQQEIQQGGKPFGIKRRLTPPFFQLISDVAAIILSYLVQYYVRFETDIIESHIQPDIAALIITGTVFTIYWLTLFFFSGLYKNWYIRSPFDEFFTVFRVIFFGCAFIVFVVLLDSESAPRYLFLIYFPLFTFFVLLGRFIARRIQIKLRNKQIISIPSLIVGTSNKAFDLYKKLEASPAWGFKANGFLFLRNSEETPDVEKMQKSGLPVFHGIENMKKVLGNVNPEEVLISAGNYNHSQLMQIASDCADMNIAVKIEPDMYNIFSGQSKTLHIYGIPLIEVSSQLMKPWQEILKRIFDLVFSFVVLVAGLPIWLLIAMIVKLESRGPAIYKQPRVGKDGRVFQIYKFRSMVSDADKKGKQWTSVNDPRVTKFGRFIRKTHLDEIPQFWNVLKGEMSIVGPRPEQPKYVDQFSVEIPYYKRRLKVRPGITGWWQVKYQPHELDKEEIENRLKDDFYYIENMSLKLDVEIVVRTVWCVIAGHGQS